MSPSSLAGSIISGRLELRVLFAVFYRSTRPLSDPRREDGREYELVLAVYCRV